MILYYVIGLMLIQIIYGKIEIPEIREVQKQILTHNNSKCLVINPDGPLNMLRGYLYNRNLLLQNKRQFASEIDIFYTLTMKSSNDELKISDFIRSPSKDKIHNLEFIASIKKRIYMKKFYNTLLRMFPYMQKDSPIESNNTNGFAEFLKSQKVNTCTYYILAALLLLSEGVDVPIYYKKATSELGLIENKESKKSYFSIQMKNQMSNSTSNTNIKDIAKIIKFFIKNRNNPLLWDNGEFKTPENQEEFETGLFLNSPKFLIQMYIYEFIQSKEDAIKLNNAVYEILSKQIADKTLLNQDCTIENDVFGKCFIEANSSNEVMMYLDIYQNFAYFIDECKMFPFMSSDQIPAYTKVPHYDYIEKKLLDDPNKRYSNCVEAAILGIFSSFAYNSKTRKYTLEHMKESKPEMQEFFTTYSLPVEIIDAKMQANWNVVPSGLSCKHIAYVKDQRNEIRAGILNLLYAIVEISGRPSSDIDRISEFMARLNNEATNLNKLFSDIQKYIQKLFSDLSYNKSVTVNCNFTKGHRSDCKNEVLGSIVITYTVNGVKNSIKVQAVKGHMIISFVPEESSCFKNKFCDVISRTKTTFGEQYSFIKSLIMHTIAIETFNMIKNTDLSNKIELEREKLLNSNLSNLDKVFLFMRITSFSVKMNLARKAFIISRFKKSTDEYFNSFYFLLNILASLPLDDYGTIQAINDRVPLYKIQIQRNIGH
ncbi:hypothetical protein NEPAR04_1441 [Nematocida parisii]|nr:hypothetical protein NEPAR08_1414 [Nematocida parisii]KAI5129191.1 hypothetical protein NEPAR03_1591 [Nematocida parisii]KAI5142085.1 hypothetical protein NEPAR04_1441 [Nematocida parisii]